MQVLRDLKDFSLFNSWDSRVNEDSFSLSRITAVIITHRDVDLDSIGRLEGLVDIVYREVYPFVDGVVVLHTCNRFEVYIDADHEATAKAVAILKALLGSLGDRARVLRGFNAIEHLYRVACGLDSVILGEVEVLGQVRAAWLSAREKAYTSRLLDMVFHGALVAGRKARRETGISRGVVGYPEAAVDLASRLLGGLDNKSVLIVGVGSAGKLMLEALCSKHSPSRIVIANRDKSKALRLAESYRDKCRLGASGLEEIYSLGFFDAVLVAVSGAPKLEGLKSIGRIIVDISTPPVVQSGENTYTIDDVSAIVRENIEKRRAEIPRVEEVIRREISRLEALVKEKRAEQLIALIMKTARLLALEEAEEAKKAIMNIGEVDGVLDRAFWSYAKKVLHPLLLGLKHLASRGDAASLRVIEEAYLEALSKRRNYSFKSR